MIVGYVWQILGKGAFYHPHLWAAPKRPILNIPNILIIKIHWILLSLLFLHISQKPQDQNTVINFNFQMKQWKTGDVATSIWQKSFPFLKTSLKFACNEGRLTSLEKFFLDFFTFWHNSRLP